MTRIEGEITGSVGQKMSHSRLETRGTRPKFNQMLLENRFMTSQEGRHKQTSKDRRGDSSKRQMT